MQPAHLSAVDLNLLVVLQRLFETGSVTGAAERLGLSQPAVSRALGRLRDTFRDALFVRTRAGLKSTPRAEELRGELAEVMARIEGLVTGPAPFNPGVSTRTFTVATSDYGEAVLLPRLLPELARQAPGVTVHVTSISQPWEAALTEGTWDLLWAPRRKSGAGVVWTQLFRDDFAFVVRKGHAASRRPLTLARFSELPQLSISPEGRPGANPLDERLAALGSKRSVVAKVPSFLVVAPLVASSDLGATLPRRVVDLVARPWGLTVLELPFDMRTFDLSQAWHERFRHDAAHAWFRQLVAALVK
ncbi:MAG: LysR family transcriptional regulator [Myxococcales bacterium]|nr:LysR family transcriptional regulator [Myxococcales bacterium]